MIICGTGHLVVKRSNAKIQVVGAFGKAMVILIKIRTILFSRAEIAQLGERQTEDLKVPGSNPENSYEF